MKDAMTSLAHTDVACCVQLFLVEHEDGSWSAAYHLSVEGPNAAMVMYPITPAAVGACGEHMQPAASVPCAASYLDAWFQPANHVTAPALPPVYRSLNAAGPPEPATAPPIELPPAKCVRNLDGSTVLLLQTADYALTEEEIATRYGSAQAYYKDISEAAFDAVVRGMETGGVNWRVLFPVREGCEGDACPEVDPGAKIDFLDQFLPNLRPGCHMLVCVPSFDEGVAQMNGAFSVVLHYPERPERVALLGHVHNVDPSDTNRDQEVEGDFYVVSNRQVKLHVDGDGDVRGTRADVGLAKAEEFLPQLSRKRGHGLHPGDRSTYASLSNPRRFYDEEDPFTDYGTWIEHCSAFQNKCKEAIWESVGSALVKSGLPDMDRSKLYCTNLVGRRLPKSAVEAVCGRDVDEASAANVVERMRRARQQAS